MRDAVVIGAGLAGLAASIRLAQRGAQVTLVTKGIGGLQLGQGTIDALGYAPELVERPLDAITQLAADHPTHPYARLGASCVEQSLEWIRELLGPERLLGSADTNVRIPTALGALRPTALYQPSMQAGIPVGQSYVIVGFKRLKDFYPSLAAENMRLQKDANGQAIVARSAYVDLDIRGQERDTTGTNFARALDHKETRERLVALLKEVVRPGESVGLPAVLGLNDPGAWLDIQDMLGQPVFEIVLQPPSVPGMRLNQELTEIAKANCRVMLGSSLVSYEVEDQQVQSVTISTAGHARTIPTKSVILAAGGFESGALEIDSYGHVRDTVMGLPLTGVDTSLLNGDFWGSEQPLFKVGFEVDDKMRVCTPGAGPVYSNVYAAGGNLAGSTRWKEKSGDGIALASALRAADSIVEVLQ